LARGAHVTEHAAGSGWSLVSTHESGIELLGWIRETSLAPETRRVPAPSGGGLGEGRIGLASCQADVRVAMVTTRARLEDAHGHPLAQLEIGDRVEVSREPTDRVAVLGLPGVRRVGQCARPLGWIAASTLDPTALMPTWGPPPLASAPSGSAELSTPRSHFVSIEE
jgi:hypothetical protein